MSDEGATPIADRAAAGLLAGTAAGLAAGALAALRPGGPSWAEAMALGAAAATVTAPLAAGLRALGAPSGAGWAPLEGAWLTAAPLGVFGALLAAKTHHRPLGAATFALVGAAVVGAAVWLCARLHAGDGVGRAGVWAARAIGAAGAVWLLTRLDAGEAARVGLVEATVLLALGALAARVPLASPRVPWLAAAAGALAVGVGGRLAAAAVASPALIERAPVLAWVAGVG
ncbi:MAG: hypothetical protein IT376_16175 [Polyangiaceae bacterium]|nr:hypothetical protein [Polyangiaceae bacterium]